MRAAMDRPTVRLPRRVPQAALTAQRRAGGLVAAGLIVAAGLGGVSLARSPGGGVLEAVGTPAPTAPLLLPAGSGAPEATGQPSPAAGTDDR
jgi:hypothetical protein